jgi:hypothetical protein
VLATHTGELQALRRFELVSPLPPLLARALIALELGLSAGIVLGALLRLRPRLLPAGGPRRRVPVLPAAGTPAPAAAGAHEPAAAEARADAGAEPAGDGGAELPRSAVVAR